MGSIAVVLLCMGALHDDWVAGPPAYDGFGVGLAPEVILTDDTVRLRNRGILVSRRETSTVDLSFDWTWTEGEELGRYHDHLCVAIGTDGRQRPWACEIDHGIVVRLNPGNGTVKVEDAISGQELVIFSQKDGFTFDRGKTYSIRIVQAGRTLKVAVDGEIALATSLPRDVRGRVAIYNRESVAAIPKESRIERLRLE